jgi:hypothetical protein
VTTCVDWCVRRLWIADGRISAVLSPALRRLFEADLIAERLVTGRGREPLGIADAIEVFYRGDRYVNVQLSTTEWQHAGKVVQVLRTTPRRDR